MRRKCRKGTNKRVTCKHPDLLCEHGFSKLDLGDLTSEGDKFCARCSESIHMKNIAYCLEQCASDTCAYHRVRVTELLMNIGWPAAADESESESE